MTPYGQQQAPPPFVGYCIRCRQPVHGQHVALPTGPVHPGCAEAGQRPQAKGRTALLIILAASLVLGFALIFILAITNARRSAAARSAAATSTPTATPEQGPAKGYLWCDAEKHFCGKPPSKMVQVYATEGDFDTRSGVPCRRGNRLCIEPSKPSLVAPGGTEVVILTSARDWREVRIVSGQHAGKTGFVDEQHVHDSLPSQVAH
jgi:hypothetical protein